MHLKAVNWITIKIVVRTYQRVLKISHDKDFSARWPMGNEQRVIEAWLAVGYWRYS